MGDVFENATVEPRTAEEVAAWIRYLLTVRAASAEAYEPIEELALRRLCRELARLERPLPDDVAPDPL